MGIGEGSFGGICQWGAQVSPGVNYLARNQASFRSAPVKPLREVVKEGMIGVTEEEKMENPRTVLPTGGDGLKGRACPTQPFTHRELMIKGQMVF